MNRISLITIENCANPNKIARSIGDAEGNGFGVRFIADIIRNNMCGLCYELPVCSPVVTTYGNEGLKVKGHLNFEQILNASNNSKKPPAPLPEP